MKFYVNAFNADLQLSRQKISAEGASDVCALQKKSLELCKDYELHSVVFPLISAGIFGYPIYDAWCQAIYACKNFINSNPDFKIHIIFTIPTDPKVDPEGKRKFDTGKEVLNKETPNIHC